MAESNDSGKQVALIPAAPGAVTTLEGTAVTAIPLTMHQGQQPPVQMVSGSWPPSSNWSNPPPPVVMIPPQQPVILVVTDSRKEAAADKDKLHSRVFARL